jgi:V8-like Glu-specific endopeptidase
MPYQAIGKLLTYFKNGNRKQGTAFYIGTNLLLTVAHNICDDVDQAKNYVVKVDFYPAQRNGQ